MTAPPHSALARARRAHRRGNWSVVGGVPLLVASGLALDGWVGAWPLVAIVAAIGCILAILVGFLVARSRELSVACPRCGLPVSISSRRLLGWDEPLYVGPCETCSRCGYDLTRPSPTPSGRPMPHPAGKRTTIARPPMVERSPASVV